MSGNCIVVISSVAGPSTEQCHNLQSHFKKNVVKSVWSIIFIHRLWFVSRSTGVSGARGGAGEEKEVVLCL